VPTHNRDTKSNSKETHRAVNLYRSNFSSDLFANRLRL